MKKFKTICLSSTSENSKVELIANQICEILTNKGCKVFHDSTLKRFDKVLNSEYRSEAFILKGSDLIIGIGGDGTILNCSRKYGYNGLPIVGINLGRLGFLSDIAPETVTNELLDVVNGNYKKDSRFFLETLVQNKKKYLALNEVVIHSGAVAQLIEFELFVNDSFVYRQKADGLIINTPTGSTAYSLSGGGPILHPSLNSLTILPMFPQRLSTSPLVVDATSKICIKLISSCLNAKISFDSHDMLTLKKNEEILITKSIKPLNLIHPINHDFFEACRTKLGWSKG